jgi:hypothetical protein
MPRLCIAVIEPYSTMNLVVTGDDSSSYYMYSVCTADSVCYNGVLYSSTDQGTSTGVAVECGAYDELTYTINQIDSTTQLTTSTTTGSAMCMYVRREIRSLTTDDLDRLMNALHTMWAVTEEDGQELYGDNYHDAAYLLEFHHFNAAWQGRPSNALGCSHLDFFT